MDTCSKAENSNRFSAQEGKEMPLASALSIFEHFLIGSTPFVKDDRGKEVDISEQEFIRLWKEDRRRTLTPIILLSSKIGEEERGRVVERRKKNLGGMPLIFTNEFQQELIDKNIGAHIALGEIEEEAVSGFDIKFLDEKTEKPAEIGRTQLKINDFFTNMLEIKEVGLGFVKFGFK